jgi:hypothetical protein
MRIASSGTASFERWWSTMMTSTPRERRYADSAQELVPQIQGHEQLGHAGLQCAVDGAAAQAVALLQAQRDNEARRQTELPQDAHQERRAAHAVDIVVAENHQRLAAGDGFLETRDGAVDPGDLERIVELGQARLEKPFRLAGIAPAGAHEQLGQHGAGLQRV